MAESTKNKLAKAGKGAQKYWKLIIVLVLIAVFAVMFILLRWSTGKQDEMKQQLDQQQEQLEYQNQVITALQGSEQNNNHSVPVITNDTIKQQLNSIRELVTQEYEYTNASRRETDNTWIFGWTQPFSKNSLILTYDGTIKAGIDLSAVEIDVDDDNRVITVTLPSSKITDNVIPQESIVVVEAKDGLFNEVTLDNYNEFISQEKMVMEQKAIDRGLLEKADEEAKKAVEAFLSVMPGIGNGEDEYKLEVKQ